MSNGESQSIMQDFPDSGKSCIGDYVLALGAIRSWVSQRRIPYTKVGRLTRFPEEHLDAWIRANTVVPEVGSNPGLD